MTKRPHAPLDSFLDARPRQVPTPAPARAGKKAKRSLAAFDIPPALLEQARDCVVALSGPPEHLTMSRLVIAALERELERLQRKHRKGKPFPRRAVPVRTGRPVSGG